MAIANDVAAEFSSKLRARGEDYQRRGRVQIVQVSGDGIDALVQGSDLYHVSLDLDVGVEGDIDFDCSCPYARDNGICKHIWATLLQADAEGLLPDAGLQGAPMDTTSAARGTAANDRTQRQPVPRWKQQLRQLRQRMPDSAAPAAPESWPAGRLIIYIVDVPGTSSGVQGLVVELAMATRTAEGRWDRPKQLRLTEQQWSSAPDPMDRQIAQMLIGARAELDYYHAAHAARRYILPETAYDTTLRQMCETGRCVLRRLVGEQNPWTIAWDDGDPWEFWLHVARDADADEYRIDGTLRRGTERMPLTDPLLLLEGGLLFTARHVARFRHFGAFELVGALRANLELRVRSGEVAELLDELYALPHVPSIDLPPELGITELHPHPSPSLMIDAPAQRSWTPPKLSARLSFDYGGHVVTEDDAGDAIFQSDARRVLHRDRPAEQAALARLAQLGFRREYDYEARAPRLKLPPAKLGRTVLALTVDGWQVGVSGQLYRAPGAFRVQVRSGIDWFELDASVEFGDRAASLPTLLAALQRGEHAVTLDDGTLGILPTEWLNRFRTLAGLGTAADGQVRFTRTQVGFLDALLASVPEVEVDQLFERAREELRGFAGVAPLDAPAGFVGELRPYQREGLGWLQFLRRFGFGGCLADDMGLGKTVQVLALLESRREAGAGPSLVVVPRSLVFNWQQEAQRFTPALRVLDHSGPQRQRAAEQFSAYDLVLTTYGTLRRDAGYFKDVCFDYVILDEAQAIKNASTASAKAARLLQGRQRVALSGTPIENRLSELWSLFEFLNPGMLGAASVFKMLGTGADDDRDARTLVANALRPFLLRRTKQQVAHDLPDKLEQTLYVDLEPAQRKLYDELRDHYHASLLQRIDRDGIRKSKIQILEALLRLRQAACHPGLIDKARAGESSSKLDVLRPKIVEAVAEDHKVLVFSQFTTLLAILRRQLDGDGITYEYLDGKTRDRQSRVARFQNDPACKVFLISLKAGGLGLNLTAADYVFLLDPWWNPAVEAQAIDRAHRIGQTRRVFASRLIARATVEEKVLELQQSKRDLADAIINADNSLIAKIDRRDLEALLG